MPRKISKIRGEHGLNFFISYQLKKRLQTLAQKYDTSLADIVRTLLKIGIPMLEGYKQAQEQAEKELDKLIYVPAGSSRKKISESGDSELPQGRVRSPDLTNEI